MVSGALRDIDIAVPFSEERLVVLMPHTKDDGALRVARRLCALVRDRPGAPKITASVGVATHGGDGTVSFGALVKRAATPSRGRAPPEATAPSRPTRRRSGTASRSDSGRARCADA